MEFQYNSSEDTMSWREFKRKFNEFVIPLCSTNWWHVARKGITWQKLTADYVHHATSFNDFSHLFNFAEFHATVRIDMGSVLIIVSDHDTTSSAALIPLNRDHEELENALYYLSEANRSLIDLYKIGGMKGMDALNIYTNLQRVCNLMKLKMPVGSSKIDDVLWMIKKFQAESAEIALHGFSKSLENIRTEFANNFGATGKWKVTALVEFSETGKQDTIEFYTRMRGDKIIKRVDLIASHKYPGQVYLLKEMKLE